MLFNLDGCEMHNKARVARTVGRRRCSHRVNLFRPIVRVRSTRGKTQFANRSSLLSTGQLRVRRKGGQAQYCSAQDLRHESQAIGVV